jgi:hypothetical protein
LKTCQILYRFGTDRLTGLIGRLPGGNRLNYKFWLKFEFFRVFTGIRGNRSSLPAVAADQSAKKPSTYASSQQEQYGLDLSIGSMSNLLGRSWFLLTVLIDSFLNRNRLLPRANQPMCKKQEGNWAEKKAQGVHLHHSVHKSAGFMLRSNLLIKYPNKTQKTKLNRTEPML